MTKILTDPAYYKAIADAIRTKNGSTAVYKPSEMAGAITAITTKASPYKITIKPTKNQTISVEAGSVMSGSGSSNASSDTVLTPVIPTFTVSISPASNYTAGSLLINGETRGTASSVMQALDKDYVISATDAEAIPLPTEDMSGLADTRISLLASYTDDDGNDNYAGVEYAPSTNHGGKIDGILISKKEKKFLLTVQFPSSALSNVTIPDRISVNVTLNVYDNESMPEYSYNPTLIFKKEGDNSGVNFSRDYIADSPLDDSAHNNIHNAAYGGVIIFNSVTNA